jgi:antitoxin ParD1/3/4
MTTMNISLPEDLKAFVDSESKARGYMSSSEYIRGLIRNQQDIARLKQMIDDGEASGDERPADDAYFAELRARIEKV